MDTNGIRFLTPGDDAVAECEYCGRYALVLGACEGCGAPLKPQPEFVYVDVTMFDDKRARMLALPKRRPDKVGR